MWRHRNGSFTSQCCFFYAIIALQGFSAQSGLSLNFFWLKFPCCKAWPAGEQRVSRHRSSKHITHKDMSKKTESC